jgi:hypothetical protein
VHLPHMYTCFCCPLFLWWSFARQLLYRLSHSTSPVPFCHAWFGFSTLSLESFCVWTQTSSFFFFFWQYWSLNSGPHIARQALYPLVVGIFE